MSGLTPFQPAPSSRAANSSQATPATTPAQGVTATIREAPSAILQMAAGSSLTATVLGNDRSGNLLVRTDRGVMALQTRLQPPVGAQITIQLRSSGAQLQALIMTVNEAPARTLPDGSVNAKPVPAVVPGGQSPAQSPGSPPTAGGGAAAPIAPSGPQAPAQASGIPRSDGISQIRSLSATVQVAATTPPPANLAAIVGGASPAAGSALALQLLQVLPSGGAPPGIALTPLRQAQPFTAEVIRSDGAGRPVLQSPLGTLSLNQSANLPAGTLLRMAVLPGSFLVQALPGSSSAAGAAGDAAISSSTALLSRTWPAMDEALKVAATLSPSGASALNLAAALPQPGPNLTPSLLFFLAALGGGELSAWLGRDSLRQFERVGQSNLVQRLSQDFPRLTGEASGEWRMTSIPLLAEEQVKPIRFFVQRQGGSEEQADQEQAAARRFLVEMTLSRLGEMQIDGLLRPRRVDLVLRSRAPLAPLLQSRILKAFEAATAATGQHGRLTFQSGRDWSFLPLESGPALGNLQV